MSHATKLELAAPVPREVDCGTNLTLKLEVSCPSGCDLRRGLVEMAAPDGELATVDLLHYDGATNGTEELLAATPVEVGDYGWTIRFVIPEADGIVHETSSLSFRARTRPHKTSLAIWGVSTPIPAGYAFDVKMGVKCAAGCRLARQRVRVRDEAGNDVGEGCLGGTPWPGTRGLYVAELRLTAPATESVLSWSGSFAGEALPTPHEAASGAFSFRTAGPPEHRVSVEVSDGHTGKPLAGVDVFMGTYLATTDALGLANLDVPKSTYELVVRKRDYEAPSRTVEVDRNECVEVQANLFEQVDPDEEEVWM